MKVVVVGAGIGGLVLAHGLKRLGIEVVVLERDTDLRRTIGHGLQLTAPAMAAVLELLPAEWVRRLYLLAQGVWVETGYTVRDDQGRLLAADRPVSAPDGIVTDRVTLRLLLAAGLEDCLHLGQEVVGYDTHRRSGVEVHLADGSSVAADLLVAADGVGSRITQRLAGGATAHPTSLVGFAGRTPTPDLGAATAELVGDGAMIAVGPGGYGLYTGAHAALDPEVVSTFTPEPLHPEPVHVWGAVMLDWVQTAPLAELDAEPLRAGLAEQLHARGWSADLVAVVEAADPDSVMGFRLVAGPSYPAGIAPWAPGVVTALGDAVHAMPPTGGKSASTAIQDAHLLCTQLAGVLAGTSSLVDAVGRYEAQMREYAALAVAESRRPPAWAVAGREHRRWLPSGRDTSLASAAVAWAQRGTVDPVPA